MHSQITVLDNDNEIINLLVDNNLKNIIHQLDNGLNNKSGLIISNILYNNTKRAFILTKHVKQNDSGLILFIYNDRTCNSLLSVIELCLREFKINMTVKEYIEKYTHKISYSNN